jgi:hypothetical protein
MLLSITLLLLACRSQTTNPEPPDTGDTQDSTADTNCPSTETGYLDADGDSWGAGAAEHFCELPQGYVTRDGDCDDGDPESYPGATELPFDGVDQDCDGADSRDGDGDGDPVDTDCDDADPTRASTFYELCDTLVDEDCDGVVDEDCQYFGGYASGAPDVRLEGTWVDEWYNRGETARQVFALGDLDGRGTPDFAIYSGTYREDLVHIFSGEDVPSDGVVDIDTAFAQLSTEEFWNVSDIYMWESRGEHGVIVEVSDGGYWNFETIGEQTGPEAAFVPNGSREGRAVTGRSNLLESDSGAPTAITASSRRLNLWGMGVRSKETIDDSWAQVDFSEDSRIKWVSAADWDGDGEDELMLGLAVDGVGAGDVRYLDAQLPQGISSPELFSTLDGWSYPLGGSSRPDLYSFYQPRQLEGDTNNDGYTDLILPGNDGALYIWFTAKNMQIDNPDLILEDARTSALGDINGDGSLDVVSVTAETNLLLGPLGTGVHSVVDSAVGVASVGDSGYGNDVVFLQDMNGDGCQELLVGDPNYETTPGQFGPGAAFLFWGAPGTL